MGCAAACGVCGKGDKWLSLWNAIHCVLFPSEVKYDEINGDEGFQSVFKFCCRESCSCLDYR